jgi:hypothetical protein
MRRAVTYILVGLALGASSTAAEKRSWNKIRYVGGTVAIKTSPFDWNVKLSVSANGVIVVTIAPAQIFSAEQTVRIKASQVVSLSSGLAAWRTVGEVSGVQLPVKPPSLFGVLQGYSLAGITYTTDDGKRGALLLDSQYNWQILLALKEVSGKEIVGWP